MIYLSTAYIYFSISGTTFDAKHFLTHFDLTPTEIGETRTKEKFLEYQVTAKDASDGLGEAMDQLMQALMPKAKAIKAYASQYGFYIKILVIIHSKNKEDNGVALRQKFIKFLNTIGAEFEVEVYDYN